MRNYIVLLLSSLLPLSGCADYASNPNAYAGYNCSQLSMEGDALNTQIQEAKGDQNTKQIYQIAMAAFAMSNGDNYNVKSDTSKIDRLNAQYEAVRHESIRKQCPQPMPLQRY